MYRLSVQVLIIALNKHQLNQNGLLKFQAGQLEKILHSLHQSPAAVGIIVANLHVDTVSLYFLFSLLSSGRSRNYQWGVQEFRM